MRPFYLLLNAYLIWDLIHMDFEKQENFVLIQLYDTNLIHSSKNDTKYLFEFLQKNKI